VGGGVNGNATGMIAVTWWHATMDVEMLIPIEMLQTS